MNAFTHFDALNDALISLHLPAINSNSNADEELLDLLDALQDYVNNQDLKEGISVSTAEGAASDLANPKLETLSEIQLVAEIKCQISGLARLQAEIADTIWAHLEYGICHSDEIETVMEALELRGNMSENEIEREALRVVRKRRISEMHSKLAIVKALTAQLQAQMGELKVLSSASRRDEAAEQTVTQTALAAEQQTPETQCTGELEAEIAQTRAWAQNTRLETQKTSVIPRSS